MTTDDNQLLTFTAAGQIAGVSHSTISKWVDGGRGPLKSVPMPKSKLRRIRKQTLLAFLDSLESSESFASCESCEND